MLVDVLPDEFSEFEAAGVEPLTLDDISFQPGYTAITKR